MMILLYIMYIMLCISILLPLSDPLSQRAIAVLVCV
jgi:hypothetical protein